MSTSESRSGEFMQRCEFFDNVLVDLEIALQSKSL